MAKNPSKKLTNSEEWLIQHGIDIDIEDGNILPDVISLAIQENKFNIAKTLLKKKSKFFLNKDDITNLSILITTNDGDMNTLQKLVEEEGGHPCAYYNAAFDIAFTKNNLDIMNYLLQKCDLSTSDIKKKS